MTGVKSGSERPWYGTGGASGRRGPGVASRAPRAATERLMRTCPNCCTELEERKCRLFCPRPGCGYFLSCADFY